MSNEIRGKMLLIFISSSSLFTRFIVATTEAQKVFDSNKELWFNQWEIKLRSNNWLMGV